MIPYSSVNFSSEDMMKMQRDAVERVREMQKIARDRIDKTNGNSLIHDFADTANTEPVLASAPNISDSRNIKNSAKPLSPGSIADTVGNLANIPRKALSSISTVLENAGIDNDRLLIIILILILLNDDGDKTIILALVYLLF